MVRRTPKTRREYRDVLPGPSRSEQYQIPAGWNPLDDYRAANPSWRPPSIGTEFHIAAVRYSCSCARCGASRAPA
ncbi:hypothetical protein ACFQ6N_04060 [Kitasatospora sp. NPDC056446]|uniref:hypothetical protein n=1 Tax=Kitasatospora sp. NPDC056446 TaxID=3345819 RepID=UPI003684BE46